VSLLARIQEWWVERRTEDADWCGNYKPHGSHHFHVETVPDDGYGYDAEQYRCPGVHR
jgi:hypothetical protein